MNNDKVGKFIKDWRVSKGLSGQALADLWGGKKSSVSEIEKGKNLPGYKILSSLRRTGMSIDRLIDNSDMSVSEHEEVYLPGESTGDIKCVHADDYDPDLLALIKVWNRLNTDTKGLIMHTADVCCKQLGVSLEPSAAQVISSTVKKSV